MNTSKLIERLDLADVIESLRATLATAQAAGSGQDIQFEVGPIEINLSVEITTEATVGAEAGGKIRFWVINADAKATAGGRITSATTQNITITLTPVDATQPDRPRVAVHGEELDNEV